MNIKTVTQLLVLSLFSKKKPIAAVMNFGGTLQSYEYYGKAYYIIFSYVDFHIIFLFIIDGFVLSYIIF